VGALTEAADGLTQVFVRVPVAVIVCAIANFLQRALEGIALVLYTSDAGRLGVEALPFAAREQGQLFIGLAIAVVVCAVT